MRLDARSGWSTAPGGRIAYVNGRYLPHRTAGVHIEDRGLQFADSVYEVFRVASGHLLDQEEHLDRLESSTRAINLAMPMSRPALRAVISEVVRQNKTRDGLVYLQVTRGAARRGHTISHSVVQPTLIITAHPVDVIALETQRRNGVAVVSLEDDRWSRCDIKTTQLLPNVLAKSKARNAGAHEAWFVDESGLVTEGTTTTAWIVELDGQIVTRPLSKKILPGVTRRVLLAALKEAQVAVVERAFTVAEAVNAAEAFISSATGIFPVTKIDGCAIGSGLPGSTTRRVQELYESLAAKRSH